MSLIFEYINLLDVFLNNQWLKILEVFNHDDRLIFTFGTSVVHLVSFLIGNLFFMFVDYTGKPAWMFKYKINKDQPFPVEPLRYLKCCTVVFFNELLSCAFIYLIYPVMKYTGMSCDQPVPALWKMYLLYALFGYINEIDFYFFHRLFHHPAIYKYFHKMHHEWKAPVSIASVYSHPLDHILSNFGPYFLPPVLLGAHLSLAWLWISWVQIETSIHHSNYHLPFLSSPQRHNYHHQNFDQCYSDGLLDGLYATDLRFQKSVESKRHRVFYSLTPIDQQHPDEHENKSK